MNRLFIMVGCAPIAFSSKSLTHSKAAPWRLLNVRSVNLSGQPPPAQAHPVHRERAANRTPQGARGTLARHFDASPLVRCAHAPCGFLRSSKTSLWTAGRGKVKSFRAGNKDRPGLVNNRADSRGSHSDQRAVRSPAPTSW